MSIYQYKSCHTSVGGSSHLDGLDAPSAAGVAGDAGDQRDAVVRGGRQIAPIIVADFFHSLHFIGAGAQRRGVGDPVAPLQVFDFADGVCGAPVVVEWGNAALPHFCGRFASPPLRTVLTPLDVYGSPSLLRLYKTIFL